MKKGFLHVSETIIMVMLVFVILFQFITIPEMRTEWERSKLTLMAYDLMYSMDRQGINWFDADEVKARMAEATPPTMGFSLTTKQDARPHIRVGCVCDPTNFSIVDQEILTDFDLNGLRRFFTVQRIDPVDLKFSTDNDVIIFWGHPGISDTTPQDESMRRYLSGGKGIVEVSDLESWMVDKQWHKDVFNLEWVTDSSYVKSRDASFPLFIPPQEGYDVKKLFYHTPYELSPESSMVGYWRMNLGRGDTAWDTSFNARHGILNDSDWGNYDQNNASKWVPGKYGSALEFDGVDDYVEVPYHRSLAITNEITVEAWIYSKENLGATERNEFVSKVGSYVFRNDERNMCAIGAPGPAFQVNLSDNRLYGVGYCGAPPPAANEWHHYVGIFDTSTRGLEFWVDGSLIASNTSVTGLTIQTSTTPLTFGASRLGINYFNGIIDEVIIYDRALSPGEISDHYTRKFNDGQGFENFVNENEKVYPLDGSTDKIVVEQASRYTGGSKAGLSVPLATINWAVEGNGRSAWLSSAPINTENKQLLKSLVIWAAGVPDYDVVIESGLEESVKANMLKALNTDMYELVMVELTLGYFY
jgi:hypothetical protein